ncbi:MAG: hypothetical protein IIB71_13925 [Proteobacteria bacterium]|nr:hypothetical protein [Pseudomonadota bacterium]
MGLPELGLVGLGITATGVNILMFLIIFIMVQRIPDLRLSWRHLMGTDHVKAILRLGTPIRFSGLGSVGTFVAVTFVITLMGSEQVAGHAIALQAANVGFVAGLQAAGIWFGLNGAVCVSSAVLVYRLHSLLPKALELTRD